MFKYVAMEHRVIRVVGVNDDLRACARIDQHSVAKSMLLIMAPLNSML